MELIVRNNQYIHMDIDRTKFKQLLLETVNKLDTIGVETIKVDTRLLKPNIFLNTQILVQGAFIELYPKLRKFLGQPNNYGAAGFRGAVWMYLCDEDKILYKQFTTFSFISHEIQLCERLLDDTQCIITITGDLE